MRNITVRLAKNEEGPQLERLLLGMQFGLEGLDWSDIEPYWLVAEDEGRIIGCVQIILGKPMGWLEFLSVAQDLGKKRKAIVVRELAVNQGPALLKGFGAQVAMGTVPDELQSYIEVLVNRGIRNTGHGFVMAKRV